MNTSKIVAKIMEEAARDYPTAIEKLLKQARIMPLDSGTPEKSVASTLRSLQVEELFTPRKITDQNAARLCSAGLWLLFDYLEECHHIAQDLETKEAAFWRAIMHRREGDFSNSKYWWRRVGDHTTFPHLHEEAKNLTKKSKVSDATSFLVEQSSWDPFAFVELCEACVKGQVPAEELCKQIQHAEWRLLFDYCYRKAIGSLPSSRY